MQGKCKDCGNGVLAPPAADRVMRIQCEEAPPSLIFHPQQGVIKTRPIMLPDEKCGRWIPKARVLLS